MSEAVDRRQLTVGSEQRMVKWLNCQIVRLFDPDYKINSNFIRSDVFGRT